MESTKKLYRSKKNRIIAGVCSGLAHYFNIDVWIVRIIFLALLFADGIAILLYILLVILVPEEPQDNAEVISPDHNPSNWLSDKRNAFALILICVGIIFLLKQILPWAWFDAHIFWPLVVVAVGIFLIIKK